MTDQSRNALKKLQRLDLRIQEAAKGIRDFDPLVVEVEGPALTLESEVGTMRNRLQEMKLEERRLEVSTEEKRARVKRLDERLTGVRNLREEAAVSAELDMVKRALQGDEQEAYTLIDQIRKLDSRLVELESALAEAKAQVEPRMKEVLEQRDAAKSDLATLEAEREAFAKGMEPRQVRLYESIRGGGRRLAVAELTEDGACGNCFGMVPLQLRNEIRHGLTLIRCEACGVILAAPSQTPGDSPGAAAGE
ncbi:MAG: hypothetical protein Q8N53_02655 [Longimicrobiales bacterium]|nr:hypothetical protein [Longimicrobiales bacterium]